MFRIDSSLVFALSFGSTRNTKDASPPAIIMTKIELYGSGGATQRSPTVHPSHSPP